MKIYSILLILMLLTNYGISQDVKRLEISYLPWSLHVRGELTPSDVRNFNNGKNSNYIINNDSLINQLITILQDIKKHPFKEKTEIDPRMIIDLKYENSETDTIMVDKNKSILYHGNIYHSNIYMINWMDANIPPAKNPFKI